MQNILNCKENEDYLLDQKIWFCIRYINKNSPKSA